MNVSIKMWVSACAATLALGSVLAGGQRVAADAVTPRSRLSWDVWKQRYDEKCAEIKTGRHYDVVFVGDSITHYWERDHKESWQKWMGKYNPLNLGILADETQHVLWRLTEGGQLDGYGPKAFVVLIGSNNVGNSPAGAEKPEWVAAGVKKIIEVIRRKHGGVKILLMAVLPRSRDNDLKCAYPKTIAAVNELIARFADEKSVFWLDCGRDFLSGKTVDGMPKVKTSLMADSLHPTAAGYEILGAAISRKLDQMLAPAPGTLSVWPKDKIPSYQAYQTFPELIITLPEKRTADAFLIVAPGGSYEKICTWEEEHARYFNNLGMATAILHYRVPRPKNLPKHLTAWQDVQRAVRIVRSHAAEWQIDPNKVGFLGHSAGGHLTVMSALSSMTPAYEPIDELDKLPCNLNFAIPCYPAYLIERDRKVDPSFEFDAATPPMCFFHGDGDGFAMGSAVILPQLKMKGVPMEFHLFTQRKHADLPWRDCTHLAWAWLQRLGFVPRQK